VTETLPFPSSYNWADFNPHLPFLQTLSTHKCKILLICTANKKTAIEKTAASKDGLFARFN